ncbi:hypothetical protein JZO73_13720 [Enterococcus plantarum]|uniref:VirB6/TrbL-like conjugal transfer protein, CD1112 family n=1 Tax=Enterococcus plantarum TaxID=1077675 RepID=UPI001A8C886B|nr:CD0415/CD1112 family protein [Enterococcus plantarum]MBO0468562.1 hypothetical protein [Enterococcus plantarum]
MFGLFDKIEEILKDFLISMVEANLSNMFNDVNEKIGTIASEVSKTPQAWNKDIFSMIRSLSETVVVPIAGMIITFVLCHELITLITEKNNMHDIDTFIFFKYFFKMFVAVYLVSHCFDITMAIFDVAQHLVNKSSDFLSTSTNIDVIDTLNQLKDSMKEMSLAELAGLSIETLLISQCMNIISILITVILYGRMVEIYLYCSISPIPFSTITAKEWNIGNNYVKGLLALGFQGFFIMVCVGIYAVLVKSMTLADNIHAAIFSVVAYTVLLCFSLFKTGSLSKSVFGAH